MDTETLRKQLASLPFNEVPAYLESLKLVGINVTIHLIMEEKIWVSYNGPVITIWNQELEKDETIWKNSNGM